MNKENYKGLKKQLETMQINWKPAPIKNSETIVKTCKCGEKHYFTNCYNKVYDRQKELIDQLKYELEQDLNFYLEYEEDLLQVYTFKNTYLKPLLDLIKEYEDE